MKNLTLVLFLVSVFIFSCKKENHLSQKEYKARLHQRLAAINNFASSSPCVNAQEWDFTEIGTKSCGGVAKYIPYPKSLNQTDFLTLVKEYTALQAEYLKYYPNYSDCTVTPVPTRVVCVNEKAELRYDWTTTE